MIRRVRDSNKNKLRSPSHIRRKRRIFWIKTISFSSLAILLIAGGIYAMRAEVLHIDSIEVDAADAQLEEEILLRIEEELKGSILWVFPRENALLIDEDGLEEVLMNDYPRVREILIDIVNFKSMVVEVSEREPFALWCEEENDNEECFYIDETGFIYSPAPLFSGSTFLRFYGGSDYENPIGRRFLPKKDFSNALFFIERIKEIGLIPEEFRRERSRDARIVLSRKTENILLHSSSILIDITQDPTLVIENLQVALTDKVFDETLSSNLPVREIDLRFGERIFFKY